MKTLRIIAAIFALVIYCGHSFAQSPIGIPVIDGDRNREITRYFACAPPVNCQAFVPIDYTGAVFGGTTNPFFMNISTAAAPNWGLGLFGSVMPTTGNALGLFDGTNLTRWKGDETSGAWVNCISGCTTNPVNSLNGQITSAMTATASTALTGMGAQGAGVRVYATACTFTNTHASVDTMINLQDGSGGAVLWQVGIAHGYGHEAISFTTPIKTTANNGLFAVNVTTGSSTFVSCTGYKGA